MSSKRVSQQTKVEITLNEMAYKQDPQGCLSVSQIGSLGHYSEVLEDGQKIIKLRNVIVKHLKTLEQNTTLFEDF